MMSDEEKQDDVFVRHPPDYRSDAMSTFIAKLDARCVKKLTTHPRGKRKQGSPRKLCVPRRAKKWMVKKQTSPVSNDTSAVDFTEQTANDEDVDPRSSESDEASNVCDKDLNVNEQDSEFSLSPSESDVNQGMD